MARPLKTTSYTDPHKLKLHLYVVGYPVEGESILIVVSEDNKALLSIVTDCYEGDGKYNHIAAILRDKWNTPLLDAFIWTHPHKDHSLGLLTLVDQFDSGHQAHIIAAKNVVGLGNYSDVWSEAANIQKELLKRYPPHSFQYHFKGYDPFEDCKFSFLLKGKNPESPDLTLSLDFFAPVGALVAQQMNTKQCKPNKGSLAFLLSINCIDVFMGGDLDEICVPLIDNNVYTHVNFIKIPHHGSEHTGKIHLKFGMNICNEVHAATTVYTRSRDPKSEILQGYLDYGYTVHCTGPELGKQPLEVYGCLHYTYDISTSQFESLDRTPNTYQFP